MIEFDPDVRGGDGYRIARDILESGRALARMNAIIDAQGRRAEPIAPGPLTLDRRAACGRGHGHRQPAPGAHRAPERRAAGARRRGGPVREARRGGGGGRAAVPAQRPFEADLEFARRMAQADSGYLIGRAEESRATTSLPPLPTPCPEPATAAAARATASRIPEVVVAHAA
jgi:thymidine phosphorylase